MTQVMKGIRVLEVAQFTFVPAAGAVLADWGADIIKIEHPVRGDTQRGLVNIGGNAVNPARNPLMQHANRGKRSVGLDISKPEGQKLLYEIAKTADVFLTNYQPSTRQKLKFDFEHIRAANPKIIYTRGSAYGNKGPERDVGGFDGTAFWTRSGIGYAMTPPGLPGPLSQGIGAFGDSIGAMYIAGGISAALLHRERTGEAVEMDVSLLSAAWWSAGLGIDQYLETGVLTKNGMPNANSVSTKGNPFMGNFRTADGGNINLCVLTPGPYIRDTFTHLGIPECADDPRFANVELLMKNWEAGSELVAGAIVKQPFAYWRQHLKTMQGQWAPSQTFADLLTDEQALANDMLIEVEAADGGKPITLVRNPVQFDHTPVSTTRCPEASEHTETFLMEMGVEWERIESLKSAGVIA